MIKNISPAPRAGRRLAQLAFRQRRIAVCVGALAARAGVRSLTGRFRAARAGVRSLTGRFRAARAAAPPVPVVTGIGMTPSLAGAATGRGDLAAAISAALYLGDCLDVLATLPDASVDAVITDPPYGLADHHPTVITRALEGFTAIGIEREEDGAALCVQRLAKPGASAGTRRPANPGGGRIPGLGLPVGEETAP